MTYGITDLASYLFAQIRQGEDERGRVYEPVIGIVTDNRDPEKQGRVKLRLPSFSSQDNTAWAHVVALGAGKDRGWFFLPEVEDEVLVMFEHGDVGRPIVIGQLWNGKDKPPLPSAKANGQRAIVSRAGSKIVFDDDGEKLTIQDAAGIGVITLDAKNKKITIEAKQGDICLQAPTGDLTIVANELDVSGTLNVHLESLQGIAVGGDKAITIKGQGILQVHGQSIDIQPGGVQAPQAAQAEPAEVPDPLTATGSGQGGAATAARDPASPSASAAGPIDRGEFPASDPSPAAPGGGAVGETGGETGEADDADDDVEAMVAPEDVAPETGPHTFRATIHGGLFDPNKVFPLPNAMTALHMAPKYRERHPATELLVVGHTDTDGNKIYNRYLSEERAKVVAAYLRRDVDAWLAWYKGKESYEVWGPLEDNHMLNLVLGEQGGYSNAKVKAFQTQSGASSSGYMNEATRRALIPAYWGEHEAITSAIATHGCGETHPEVATADGVGEARNRRVEIFLFEGRPVTPPPETPCPIPGCAGHAGWLAELDETIDLAVWQPPAITLLNPRWEQPAPPPGENWSLRVLDHRTRPAKGAEVTVSGGSDRAFAVAGDDGLAALDLDAQPTVTQVRYERPGRGGLIERAARWDLPPIDDVEGAGSRLAQIGFDVDASAAHALYAFQREQGLPPTVSVDEATAARLDELFGGSDVKVTAIGPARGGSSLAILGTATEGPVGAVLEWAQALASAHPVEVATQDGQSLATALRGVAASIPTRVLPPDVLDDHFGGLRGHTVVIAFEQLAQLDGLAAALRRTPFEHIYLLPCAAVDNVEIATLAWQLWSEVERTVFYNVTPASVVPLDRNAPNDERRPEILSLGEPAMLGRWFWSGEESPSLIRLDTAPDGFLFGAQERVP